MGEEGVVHWHQFPQWAKGPARIEGEEIVLDEDRTETYYIHGPEDLIFDLATLYPFRPDFRTQDAIRFVRHHGLLWHGPEAVGSGQCRESLKDWWLTGYRLSVILTFHQRLMEAVETGSVEPLRSLPIADSILTDPVAGRSHTDYEYLAVASMVLADLINERLGDCREGIAAACGFEGEGGGLMGDPGVFMYDIRPPTLEAAAYSHLAQLVVTRIEMSECPGCGRTFAPKSGRQKYCTERCASTSRARRFRQRKSDKT